MSISRKKTNTLISIFLENPRKFENYVKGCLNSIKKINYLKEIQFDENVDDYDYFKCFSGAIPFDLYLAMLNMEYKEKVLEQIPKEKIVDVKTNVFYIDNIGEFLNNLEKCLPDSTYSRNNNHRFSRMFCTIIVNQSQLCEKNDNNCVAIVDYGQNEKIYSVNELITLSQNNMISVIDNYVKPDDINEEKLLEGLTNGTMVFQKADLNSIGFDNKIHADYVSCKTEYDRMVWYELNANFFKYIRKYKIYCSDETNDNHSGYNLNYTFYKTIKQLEDIFSIIKANYRKKKKSIPNVYEKIIRDALYTINDEKSKFQNSSQKTEKNKTKTLTRE